MSTETTTAVNACNAVIELDNAAGTIKDVTGSSSTVSMKFTNAIGMVRNFATRWPTRQECGKDCVISWSPIYTTATDEGWSIVKNWFFNSPGKRTIHIYVPTKDVGSDHYYGEVRLQDMNVPLEAGKADPIVAQCTLVPDGTFTLVTNAT